MNVVIVIAPPADIIAQAISRIVAAARHAQFVSPGTNGVQLTISQSGTQIASNVADVSSGSSLCSSTGGARTCTVPLNVASGTYTFGLTSYNQAPSGGVIPGGSQQLGTATATATVLVGQTNQINFFIGAVVSSVGIGTQGTTAAYSSLPADGNTHNYAVSIIPTDASGNPISGSSSSLANPVTVTLAESGGSGHAHLVYNGSASGTSATVTHASDSLTIAYDGAGSAGYSMTITFAASGAPTSTLTVSPMYVAGDSKYASGQVLFTATTQSEPFTITEQGAPGSVVYTSSGAVCPALPTGSNPQLALPLTGVIAGSGSAASMTVTDNIAPKTPTGCSATIADNLGTAFTIPITLASGTGIASSAVVNAQVDPTHYSTGTPATFNVTYNGNPVSSVTLQQGTPLSLVVSEADDVSAPSVTQPSSCSGIATVASSLTQGTWSSSAMGSLSGSVVLVGTTSGTCSVQISDGNGQSQTIIITAQASGQMTEYRDAGHSFHFLAAGPDGNLWANDGNSTLTKINPANGTTTDYSIAANLTGLGPMIAGPDGNLWLTGTHSGTFSTAKINPSTGTYISSASNGIVTVTGISVAGGNIWIAGQDNGDRDAFSCMSTSLGFCGKPETTGGSYYGAVTIGGGVYSIEGQPGGGALYVGTPGNDFSVNGGLGPIDATNSLVGSDVAAGSDGNIWGLITDGSNFYLDTFSTCICSAQTLQQTFAQNTFTAIGSGPNAIIWGGGEAGNGRAYVERFGLSGSNQTYTKTTTNAFLSDNSIIYIVQGPDGNEWFLEGGVTGYTGNGYFGFVTP